jgi:hypothetical protein
MEGVIENENGAVKASCVLLLVPWWMTWMARRKWMRWLKVMLEK